MKVLKRLGGWLIDRAGLGPVWRFVGEHPVPPGTTRGASAWMYIFGAATLAAFILQIVTGVILATYYVPSAAHAYQSLQFISEGSAFSRVVRGMHYWGASAMVLLILLHAARVFLTGSYKFPREFNWITGVGLLGLTMTMAATGQLLRWDQNGVWTVVVWANFAARVPVVGEGLARFMLAGETLGGATLSRFFAAHVFIIPALIILIVGWHLYLVLHHGISEPPRAGRPVDRRTYRDWYERMLQREGRPYWPDAAWKEVVAGAAVVLGVVALAVVYGPRALAPPPDPTVLSADPRPDWYLRWYYALLAVKPRGLEDAVMVYLPLALLLGLLLLPLLRREGERGLAQRPWAIGIVALTASVLIWLTALGLRAPWVPAFAVEPLPAHIVGTARAPVAEGARLFHAKGCLYCHVVGDRGGAYGPDLTAISDRLTPERLTTIILHGRGDMPGYGSNLTPAEMEALLAFLETRRAREQPAGGSP